jgi:bifunctional UDP-N-acetylglucosamine pyrophosphorylase/glucosamine-1-phosphate N-acetyltransferase
MSAAPQNISCIILAAGLGKRLGGSLPKALTKTRQGPLIDLVLNSLAPLNPQKTVVVIGHMGELIEQHLTLQSQAAKAHSIAFAIQPKQLGTGDAAKCALPHLLDSPAGTVIICYADHPLFRPETLAHFVSLHEFKKATVSLISFTSPPPNGYGRVICDPKNGEVLKITEAKDCNPEELLIDRANSGVYAVDSSFLKPALDSLENNNAQSEYYLTDIVAKATSEGQRVSAFNLSDPREAAGVNDLNDLALINSILAEREIAELQRANVVFSDPSSCSIDPLVKIAPGVRIGPAVEILGESSIAEGVVIEGSCLIIDSKVGPGVTIRLASRVEGAVIGAGSTIGPCAHVRPGSVFSDNVRIGNFVETKNAILGEGAKASHLSYLGDCKVGAETNIGAGTITCNYDGYQKSHTEIGSGVFVGSDSCLVAPITIGDGALIAAGSVVTHDVPKDALAVGRAKQSVKLDWARRRREARDKA